MNNLAIGKQLNTHLHKWTPVTLSGGLVKTNNHANNEQADNVKLIPKPKQSSFKKKLSLAFLGALTLGGIGCGTVGPGKILEFITAGESNETISPVENELAKLQRKLKEDIKNEAERLQHIEIREDSNTLSGSNIKLVYDMRAEYNLTNDANVFNEYLPYRKSIANNPEKLAQYESLVSLIQQRTTSSFCPDVDIAFLYNGGASSNPIKLDPSTSYMYAAQITEILHNRKDVLDKIIPPLNGKPQHYNFEIQFCPNKDGRKIGGFYNSKYNSCALDNGDFWGGIADKNDQYNPLIHEIGHAIDYAPLLKDPRDGILAKMDSKLKEKFLYWRQAYYNTYNKNDKELAPDKNSNDITSTGLRAYAFRNECEFLGVSLESFYEKPETIQDTCPDLYNVYRDYFKLDPLNGYKDLIINEPVCAKSNSDTLKVDNSDGIFY